MNYSEGISGSKILINTDNKTCDLISKFLSNYIKMNLKNNKWEYIDSKTIIDKAEDTLKKTKIRKLKVIGSHILKKLKKKLAKKHFGLQAIVMVT